MEADTPIGSDEQARLNAERWSRGEYVDFYATSDLRPAEERLLERYASQLAGNVLELGSGAGRLTGHLCKLAATVYGVELSAAMVAYCRETYPDALISEGDIRDLSRFDDHSLDAVFGPFNVLDVLGDDDRGILIDEIRRVLRPSGLLLFSSHNRNYNPWLERAIRVYIGSPRHLLRSVSTLPDRLRNRRRLRRLERVEAGYELRNDEAHDFGLLHYYISPEAQVDQLGTHGFEFVECLELDGRPVPAGASAAHCPELHYVARAP